MRPSMPSDNHKPPSRLSGRSGRLRSNVFRNLDVSYLARVMVDDCIGIAALAIEDAVAEAKLSGISPDLV